MNKIKVGGIIIGVGAVVAFSPLAMAFFSTTPGHNMWSEGDARSGGSYLWGMLITLPLGFVIGLVGLILLIIGSIKPAEVDASGKVTASSGARGAGITMIVLGSILILVNLPIIASVIGAFMALAGASVIWTGVRLLRKGGKAPE